MCDEGITEGDLLIVDRSLQAEHGDLAICALDGEFTLKRICVKKYGRIFLMPSNPRYMPIEVSRENDFEVWGVVIYTIKANRRNQPRTSKW